MVLVSEQLEDYRTVIKYARQQPEFDPQRIIVWGSSFSGKAGTLFPIMSLILAVLSGAHAVTLASEVRAEISIVASLTESGLTFYRHRSMSLRQSHNVATWVCQMRMLYLDVLRSLRP